MALLTIEELIEHRALGSRIDEEELTRRSIDRLIKQGADGVILKRLTLRIPIEVLANALSVDRGEFSNLFSRKLNSLETDVLFHLASLWGNLRTVFGNDEEHYLGWLDAPQTELTNLRPIELLDTIPGRRVVQDLLNSKVN